MKLTDFKSFLILTIFSTFFNCIYASDLTAFYKVAVLKTTFEDAKNKTESALKSKGFEIIGGYSPVKDKSMYVMTFTRKDLQEVTSKIEPNGILASVMRIGYLSDSLGNIEISLLNPEYVFYGFLRDAISDYEIELSSIANDVKESLSALGGSFEPYGSTLEEHQLKMFRYIAKYPAFEDILQINEQEFNSFDEGLATVLFNLKSQKGGAVKVYEIINKEKQYALIGIGLTDKNTGEGLLLDVLGKKYIAALPYQMIISGKKAFVLPGRFVLPFYWSHETMATFRTINRLPKDLEYTLSSLTKK